MSEIIPFDFEEQAVRVVMRDGDPWFVAADVCRVLEISNPTDAVKRLDDDEFTLDTIEGSHRPTNLVSESGLYALVLTSRKEAARRFRKWITAEVLPAIRRTGRYEFTPPAAAPQTPEGDIAGLPYREAELWLSMVREARLTRGARAGVAIWDRSPLPPLAPGRALPMRVDPAEAQDCLDFLLLADVEGQPVSEWIAAGAPSQPVADGLARAGLRILPAGLFVGNITALFSGTRWAGGAHKPVLLSLPGVVPDAVPRTLAGQHSRGIVLPFAVIAGGVDA